MKRRCGMLVIFVSVLSGLYAQAPGVTGGFNQGGGNTPAERYFLWIQHEINEGRWQEAAAALERAADFSDELSDISFLRALVYAHENRSRRLVLNALVRAIQVSRWKYYNEAQARFMAAEYLVALRYYADALDLLSGILENADTAALKLAALKGLSADSGAGGNSITGTPALRRREFRRTVLETMDRYPRDPRPLQIFFDYAGNIINGGDAATREGDESDFVEEAAADGDEENSREENSRGDGFVRVPPQEITEADYFLMEIVLRRLPLTLESDPELAWMAAPFIRDREEARRLLGAYRAGSLTETRAKNFRPNPASIPCALELSLISGAQATEELFAASAIDRDLIARVSGLLDSADSRNIFLARLLSFNGVIVADDDRDGIPESRIFYHDGALREYYLDEDQDGITDLYISFINGVPQWARLTLAAGQDTQPAARSGSGSALLHWAKYPAVFRVEAEGIVYIPRPMEFHYAPLRFTELSGSETYSGLLFPLHTGMRLERRPLVLHALQIQRPSREFEGAVEWIDMDLGIPWRSTEILNGRLVSITEYENGQPVVQWIDLDKDSRMETVRRFRKMEYSDGDPLDYQRIIESSQSDWNGDGFFEYAEEYLLDGSIVYSMDIDGSGVRSYSETRTGNANHETER